MKHILLFGAGKSATALIGYLKKISEKHQWKVTIADNDINLVQSKVGEHPYVMARQININEEELRKTLIQSADIVISMMPPNLHFILAKDCLEYKKHLLTASYTDNQIRDFALEIKNKGLLFLYEMGLDPGIDHMSAMQLIHRIKNKGGKIISFKSHCGGLVAPESDNNPWHYKISWNPRNVVLAGKAGAVFKEKNEVKSINYEELFQNCEEIELKELGKLAWYPNRDSLNYISTYGLEEAETFIRTTLRPPEFCTGWKQLVNWKMTGEEKIYNTTNLSLATFYRQYFIKAGYNNAMDTILKNSLLKKQFECLGLFDYNTFINNGLCSLSEIIQFILERKLALRDKDRDMIVMLHEIENSVNNQHSTIYSLLVIKGEDSANTAMAKAVGLPLGIAAKLILESKIKETGLHIPVAASIYEPVLNELKQFGIEFKESIKDK